MDLSAIFEVGQQAQKTYRVDEEHLALTVGSGASRVLATPWMIAFMERVSHAMLAEQLPNGYSSVGVLVNVRHLAPTPLGAQVRIQAAITAIHGSRVTFQVEAWDDREQVGAGKHQRFVIDAARFLERVDAKRAAKPGPE